MAVTIGILGKPSAFSLGKHPSCAYRSSSRSLCRTSIQTAKTFFEEENQGRSGTNAGRSRKVCSTHHPRWRYDTSAQRSIRFTLTCFVVESESTTIALLARLAGLLDPLREFLKHNPVWGTCAGAILLSRSVVGAKKGGQELLGGMSITIARNGWGSQVCD